MDGEKVGVRFQTLGVAFRSGGQLSGFAEAGDIVAYYQAALDQYAGKGACACRHFDLETHALCEQAVVATVTWELLDNSAAVVARWR